MNPWLVQVHQQFYKKKKRKEKRLHHLLRERSESSHRYSPFGMKKYLAHFEQKSGHLARRFTH